MFPLRKQKPTVLYFLQNLGTVVGLVLIWRGTWYVLDGIDLFLFAGDHTWSAVGGIVLGLAVLYWPDKNLDEIKKL